MSPTPEATPQRFPFRLAEKLEVTGDGHLVVVLATADGALTGAGPWPVTLVAEALAQAIILTERPAEQGEPRLVELLDVEALQPVEAGDRLEVEVSVEGSFGALRRYRCRALKSGALAAVARITVSG